MTNPILPHLVSYQAFKEWMEDTAADLGLDVHLLYEIAFLFVLQDYVEDKLNDA